MADGQRNQGSERIPVGYVRKAHGIRGDVVVRGLADDAGDRLVVGAVFETDQTPPVTLTVSSVGMSKDDFRIGFDEVGDRNDAEHLKGVQLTIDASERRELADGEWWPEDLIGCQVMAIDGGKVGIVHEVIIGAAQDRLVVIAPDGATGEIPFVAALVPEVDITNDRIVVDLPEGLFDE
jgi:16S rRNA processing protein RimM